MSSEVMYTWIAIAAGGAVWWLSLKIKSPERVGGRARLGLGGKLLSVIGLALLILGLYAGFAGPVTVGPVTLGTLPFAHFVQKSHAEADEYAKANVQIVSKPAPGWRGGSKTTLECMVQNNGDRRLSRLYLRLDATTGKPVELRLDGPFPQKRTTTTVLTIPDNVSRDYFQGPGLQVRNIIGARF